MPKISDDPVELRSPNKYHLKNRDLNKSCDPISHFSACIPKQIDRPLKGCKVLQTFFYSYWAKIISTICKIVTTIFCSLLSVLFWKVYTIFHKNVIIGGQARMFLILNEILRLSTVPINDMSIIIFGTSPNFLYNTFLNNINSLGASHHKWLKSEHGRSYK